MAVTKIWVNGSTHSLALVYAGVIVKNAMFKLVLQIDIMSISWEIALMCVQQAHFNAKSTLTQAMLTQFSAFILDPKAPMIYMVGHAVVPLQMMGWWFTSNKALCFSLLDLDHSWLREDVGLHEFLRSICVRVLNRRGCWACSRWRPIRIPVGVNI